MSWIENTLGRIDGFLSEPWFQDLLQGSSFQREAGIYHAVSELKPGVALNLMKRLVNLPGEVDVVVTEVIAGLTSVMLGIPVDVKSLIESPVSISQRNMIENMGSAFLEPMLGLIMPSPDEVRPGSRILPEVGQAGANRYLGVNLEFQMVTWFLHFLGDIKTFGAIKSIKDLPMALNWSYGLGWLSWLVMGVPFKVAISDPMQEGMNRIYRPTRIAALDLWRARHSSLLTQEEYIDELRAQGYAENIIGLFRDRNRAKFTDTQLKELYQNRMIGADYFKAAIMDVGYEDVMADQIVNLNVFSRYHDLLRKIADQAMISYEKDLIDVATLSSYLDKAYYDNDEQTAIIMQLNMKKQIKDEELPVEKRLTPANIGRLYQLGKFTQNEAIIRLTNLNYQKEEIPWFLELYAPTAKASSLPKEAGASVLGALYKRGEMTEADLRADLKKLKYDSASIDALILYYAPAAPAAPKKAGEITAAEIGRLYKNKTLTLTDATARLEAKEMSAADATLFLSLYQPKV